MNVVGLETRCPGRPFVLVLALLCSVVLAGCERRPLEPAEQPEPPVATRPYLVLLSLDGFRPDYLADFSTVHLSRVIQRGTLAEALVPAFPTLTFPNHYTQVTGLYPERHGIVGNSFWDPQRMQQYSFGNRAAVEDGTWYRGEPIWVTAERQGVRAASFYWAGSEADIQGMRPTYWKRYDGRVPNAARVDTVLGWLRLPPEHRPHLVTLYMSSVDGAGHVAGPHTHLVEDAILDVDAALGRLLDGIATLPQRDSVYLMIMSDHGMARYESDQYERLADHIDLAQVRVAVSGTFASLHVQPGGPAAAELRDRLNAGLRHGRAHLRQETPAHLRYRADPRIGDVVVLMDEPYQILRGTPTGASGGHHGWAPDSEAMQGMLLLLGPSIPDRRRIPPVRAVDLYPFFAEILRLQPNTDIDGEPGALRRALDGP
jgi:predicted AlkP superfamily pyrophosphatase or phosphodiesterase